MRKLFIFTITVILSLVAAACSSETKDVSNQSEENAAANIKSAMEIVKKAKEKLNTIKGESYTEKYKLEHTFQTEGEDGMPVNLTNIREGNYEHDRTFNPYATRTIGQYESTYRTNLAGYKGDNMSDTNVFEQEEYVADGKVYYRTKPDTKWSISPLGKVPELFRTKLLDELMKTNNDKNIKMSQADGMYKLVFDKAYFDVNKPLFEFYKKSYPFYHATDSLEEKLKKDSGQTILYKQSEFKNPTIELWVDQKDFMIKKFSVISSIRIPTVSSEKGKDGKAKVFPPFYIEEQWSAETKQEFTDSISLPSDVK